MINVTLQHVVFTDINDKSATSKLQENMHTTSSVLAESKQTENTPVLFSILVILMGTRLHGLSFFS